jgi:hypothetical protein
MQCSYSPHGPATTGAVFAGTTAGGGVVSVRLPSAPAFFGPYE